jgi:DNA-binding response OmpR family regulator
MSHQLLLADEDPRARLFLADNLTADGYIVRQAADRDQAQAALRVLAPDVILADVNGQTLALLDWLRVEDGQSMLASRGTPVLVLSSRGDELHRIRLLERGADDVVEKPASYPELRARLTALLRRTNPRRAPQITVAGPVRIDHRTRSVTVHDALIAVSGLEYRLLCHLAAEPTRVFTREELLRDVWGYPSPAGLRTRTLDTHATRLRVKLRQATDAPLLSTVWGVGYQLTPPEREQPPAGSCDVRCTPSGMSS